MPLLKIAESKKITIYSTIEETTVKQIEHYAAKTKGTVDEVVQQALDYVFSRDKDFEKFRTENPEAKPKEPCRVKRSSGAAALESTPEAAKNSSPPRTNGAR
jgi:hypothetical protein